MKHAATVLDIDLEIVGAVHREAAVMGRALTRAYGATGLNIFQNNGIDARQHVAHWHVHVVPRYPGSDPTRIYQQAEFLPIPRADQLAIASKVRIAVDSSS